MIYNNIRLFVFPIIFTISFIPFLYLLRLFSVYESLFTRVKTKNQDSKFKSHVKREIIKYCKLNLYKLNKFSSWKYFYIEDKSKIISMINEDKKVRYWNRNKLQILYHNFINKMNSENWLIIALMWFLWAIIWWFITSFSSNYFWKNNEIETRVFEIKREIYENFLDDYYNTFNWESIAKSYEEEYKFRVEKYMYIDHHWLHKISKEIKNCFYDIPSNCNTWEFVNCTIGSAQNDSIKYILKKKSDEFIEKSYKYKLFIPNEIFKKITEKINNNYLWVNNFYDCGSWNGCNCGFNFLIFEDNLMDTMWVFPIWKYSLRLLPDLSIKIDSSIISILKNDIKKHYE